MLTEEMKALRDLGERLAPPDLQPPSALRYRVLGAALTRPPAPPWYRRHTRPLTLLAAACLTGALALSPQLLDRPADPSSGLTPAEQEAPKDCNAGTGRSLTVREVPDLLYLPPQALSGPLTERPSYGTSAMNCAPTEGGQWYSSSTDGRVIQHFTLMGPNQANYYGRPGSPVFGGEGPIAVEVNGNPAALYFAADFFSGLGRLFWSTPDGQQWHAEGWGMTAEEILIAARSSIRDGKVTSAVPAGLQRAVPEVGTPPASATVGAGADFNFGRPFYDQESDTMESTDLRLTVSVAGRFPGVAYIRSRPVDINGVTGWLTEDSDRIDLLWVPRPGIVLHLSSSRSLAKTLEIARATVQVAPDDVRLR